VSCGALLAVENPMTTRQKEKIEIERQQALEVVNKNNPTNLMIVPYQ
jgi:hypothetical protein